MTEEPFYDEAPPGAAASLERGLEQMAREETVSLDELSRRLEAAAQACRQMKVVLSPEAAERIETQIALPSDAQAFDAAEHLRVRVC